MKKKKSFKFESLEKFLDEICNVHEGKKPYKCDICEKRATLKWFVRKHISAIPIHEGKKPTFFN